MVRLQLSVAVLCICFFVVSTNRYFVLQNEGDNGQSEGESGQTPPINSAYFQCDQQTTCTHVVKFKETDKFGIIFGHDQLAKIKEKVSVWKKKDVSYDSCRKVLRLHGSNEGTFPIRRGSMKDIVTAKCLRNESKFMAVFHHDSEATIRVKGFEEAASYRRKINYSHKLQDIIEYVDSSKTCRQFTRFDCHGTALYGVLEEAFFSYIVDRNGNQMRYIGGGPHDGRGCRCGVDGNCSDITKKCNCDVNDDSWRFDEGYITEKSRLPITEVRFGDTGGPGEEAKHTIGRLECFD